MAWRRRPELWVFLILFGTYAYYWQSRDWNSASRLMLAYAIVDHRTVVIDGFEDQTRDRAFFQGHYYSDKLPGFPMLATIPYAAARLTLRVPPHPTGQPGFAYWEADYWTTLGTSGLLTALAGVVLTILAREIGCGPRASLLVGLCYGLATPAYAYATMSYGHQASACCLIASFALLRRRGVSTRAGSLAAVAAGFLAAYASVIELQVGPVSAILGLYLIAQAIGGHRRVSTIGDFAVGAALPSLLLLGYNQLAFGSPWDMGYFHHATKIFADVHSEANPLGLQGPSAGRAIPLLWGRHRGLLFYAPALALVPFGLVALAAKGQRGMAVVASAVMASVFAVNLSYPEWTGGWSTGPRLLVPLLPFAMLPVAGWLSWGGRWAFLTAAALSVGGAVLMFLFVGAGGRFPQWFMDPLVEAVWPLWNGQKVPELPGDPFDRNVLKLVVPRLHARMQGRGALSFMPLALAQLIGVSCAWKSLGGRPEPRREV